MSLSVTSACPTGIHVGFDREPKRIAPEIRIKPDPTGFDLLSEAERKTLSAVIRCGMAKTAARELGISFRTVEVHMQRARDKTGFSTSLLMLIAWDRLNRKESN